MTLLHIEEHPPINAANDAEALMREARRRTRRRRIRQTALLAVLLGIGMVIYALRESGPSGSITETTTRPFANLRAFDGHGELAFISRGRVWALDGSTGTLRELPTPANDAPSSPALSPDGRWLAYFTSRDRDVSGPYELWLAHANGTGAHRVRGLTVNQPVGWSPTTDLMAVEAGESRYPNGAPTAVDLVSPNGRTRTLFKRSGRQAIIRRGAIQSVVWSPYGSSLAMSTYSFERNSGTHILELPIAVGARSRVWFSMLNSQSLNDGVNCGPHCVPNQAIAKLAGWWPKWGIGFWVFSSGMTHNSDSTPLVFVSGQHTAPREIARTLSDGTTDAVTAGPDGQLAVVASGASAGREYGYGKTVERCSLNTITCTPLSGDSTWTGRALKCKPCFDAPATGPGSAVSLDPAWSPDGTLLAYVKAPAYRSSGFPGLAWFGAHQLYVWNARTNTSQKIGTITGSSLPTWSHDGRSVLYVRDDGLWMANLANGNAAEIAHPLYAQTAWNRVATTWLGYYGQIAWSQQFSWHTD